MGHTAWAPEGLQGQSQKGPKGLQLEVGARRVPRLLVYPYYCGNLDWLVCLLFFGWPKIQKVTSNGIWSGKELLTELTIKDEVWQVTYIRLGDYLYADICCKFITKSYFHITLLQHKLSGQKSKPIRLDIRKSASTKRRLCMNVGEEVWERESRFRIWLPFKPTFGDTRSSSHTLVSWLVGRSEFWHKHCFEACKLVIWYHHWLELNRLEAAILIKWCDTMAWA